MMKATPGTLQHEDIARRIPHQGSMCLLESVLAWDDKEISCTATSHTSTANPLRAHGRLGAACGIEYAAQAMAVHGALVAEAAGRGNPEHLPKAGYLVSVRSVTLHVERLDGLGETLEIDAVRSSGDAGSILYSFSVRAGQRLLVDGRAAVMLQASRFASTNR